MERTRGLSFSPNAQFRSLLKFQYSSAELLLSFQVHFLFEDPSGRYAVVAFWLRVNTDHHMIYIYIYRVHESRNCQINGCERNGCHPGKLLQVTESFGIKLISDSVYASRNITKQNNCAFTAFISLGIFGVFQRKGSGTVKAVPSFHFHLILHYPTLFRIYRNEGVFLVCAWEWRKRKINNLYRIFQITLCLCSYLIFFFDILLRKKTWF